MKKICLFLIVCFITFSNLSAQTQSTSSWGNLPKFSEEEVLNYQIDFTNAIINAQEVEIFIAHESKWEEGVNEMNYNFMNEFNSKAYRGNFPHRIAYNQKHRYTINVHVKKITTSLFSKRRTRIVALITITDTDNNILFSKQIQKKGGLFGSNLRQMNIALQNIGKALGKEFFQQCNTFYINNSSNTESDTEDL